MLVSIIVPVYNSENFLEKCLESLIHQTYVNIEIICVNDGSTDNSLLILKKYKKADSRIKIIDQENSGAYFARKEGFNHSSGQFICFVDSDDWLDNDAINKMINCISDYQCDVVKAGIVREMSNDYKDFRKIPYDDSTFIGIDDYCHLLYPKLISSNFYNSMCCELISRSFVCFNEDKRINMGEDFNFNLDLFKNRPRMYVLNDYLYHYSYNSNSSTVSIPYSSIKNNMNAVLYIYEKVSFLISEDNEKSSLVHKSINKMFLEYINQSSMFFKQKDYKICFLNFKNLFDNSILDSMNSKNKKHFIFKILRNYKKIIYSYLLLKNFIRRIYDKLKARFKKLFRHGS